MVRRLRLSVLQLAWGTLPLADGGLCVLAKRLQQLRFAGHPPAFFRRQFLPVDFLLLRECGAQSGVLGSESGHLAHRWRWAGTAKR